ncbi:MAG TPA: ChaN family lipoprotein [Polyangiaceae bacterium]|jgi:uncharacterized iron-regulated protein|nr:ChaN family lipoprotein [Polyangiaceae bacterium]
MRFLGWSLVTLFACGCATTTGVAPIGVTTDAEAPGAPPPAKAAPKESVPEDVVARAAGTFHARRNADGGNLSEAALFDELSHFDVLCLGEAHDEARDHFAELAVVEGLARRARVSGRALGVGFEMFQEPYGDALRSYESGRLDDAGLRKKTHYDDRWGFPYAYYRPVLAYGRAFGLSLKALNAPRELTHAISQHGLSELSPRLRRELPDLDLTDAAHRAQFDHLMADHPDAANIDLDKFYEAQVVWDETMASNAARWVAARAPSRQLVVLAGSAHCRQEAIPARVERRVAARVANVRLSAKTPEDSEGFSYTLLFDEKSSEPSESRDDG